MCPVRFIVFSPDCFSRDKDFSHTILQRTAEGWTPSGQSCQAPHIFLSSAVRNAAAVHVVSKYTRTFCNESTTPHLSIDYKHIYSVSFILASRCMSIDVRSMFNRTGATMIGRGSFMTLQGVFLHTFLQNPWRTWGKIQSKAVPFH